MRGQFITFEGVEGSGKSTQVERLARVLLDLGVVARVTREPGGTELGQRLRDLLLGFETPPEPLAELFMLLADRAQHVAEVVRPALAAGEWVIADRYIDATRAYQVAGRGLDAEFVEQAMTAATGGLTPDLTLLLDLPVEDGLARAHRRGDANRLDHEEVAFHERVRAAYRKQLQLEPSRITLIDATPDPDTVFDKVMRPVRELYEATRTTAPD